MVTARILRSSDDPQPLAQPIEAPLARRRRRGLLRYRADGSVIGGFDSIYVVTCENGHWGIKARSSFAP